MSTTNVWLYHRFSLIPRGSIHMTHRTEQLAGPVGVTRQSSANRSTPSVPRRR